MKYITLIIGLLVVGCGKQEQADTNESTPTTTEKPVKELTLEEKVIGEYEMKEGEDTRRAVFLDNGVVEDYKNGKKREGDHKWTIINGELHIVDNGGVGGVFRINPDGSITIIADIDNGERTDLPKEEQTTIKKIK